MKNKNKHNDKPHIQQGFTVDIREPNKIDASTHYTSRASIHSLRGLFPVATMLEKLDFQK